jgi:hypothetical protein
MPTEPGPPAGHWSATCDEMARRAQSLLLETRLHVVLTREASLRSRELVQAVRSGDGSSARNEDGGIDRETPLSARGARAAGS